MIPSPPLRLLLRLKLRGTLRRSWRKVKTVKGAFLGILGLGLFGLWFGSVAFTWTQGPRAELAAERLETYAAVGLFALIALSLSNAFTFRGLFMPAQEIERLFTAPLPPADLVRYRLWTNFGRGLFGSIVVALFAARRMPSPGLAFAGTFLAVQTIPVLHQLLAILAGTFERRVARRFAVVRVLGIVVGVLALVSVVMAGVPGALDDVAFFDGVFDKMDSGAIFASPWVGYLRTALAPWVKAIAAPDLATFLPPFAVALFVWLALIELTARLPVDFRETSLDTASDVAARLRRMGRGGGAAAAKVSTRAAGLPIPWWAGRGPVGAIAWRKTAAIARKAKGTLLVSALVLLFVSFLASTIIVGEEDDAGRIIAPLFIAVLGTLYLCGGLRFDFRDELERMDVIKAWPLGPSKLFFAMLLPQALLISALLSGVILLRAALTDAWHPTVPAVLAILPLVVFAWIALDNAAFLFAPVRLVPGQEGALQNAGRALLMMLVRGVLLVVVASLAGAPAFLVFRFREELGLSGREAFAVATGVLGFVLLIIDGILIRVGGWRVKRFDVARDRG